MKLKKIYICSKCGSKHLKWQGQCSECGEWNSLVEDVVEESTKTSKKRSIVELSTNRFKLKEIAAQNLNKISTDIKEFDRVLTGGVVLGQTVLIGGVPGIGKSTLIMEIADKLASKNLEVLYISGEESPQQLAQRAKRLDITDEKITVASITDISEIIKTINEINPNVLIVDSIQTLYHPQYPSSTASPVQIRECANELVKIAKTKNIIVFILGQVTKEGDFAGPKLLEHMVDTVLYFENDKDELYRILRTFKNRFGTVDEIGIFEMTEKGLVSKSDYESSFLNDTPSPGASFSATYEGTRPVIIKVEALVNRSFYPYPKRIFSSIDSNYAQILLASIEKNTPVKFDSYDVYINVKSGFKTKDRALDLAVCASAISSIKEIPIDSKTAFIGEVGMLGYVYPAIAMSKRIAELERIGFKKIIISSKTSETLKTKTEIIKIERIAELYSLLNKNYK